MLEKINNHKMRDKYLTFLLDDELYGLSIELVKEIIAPITITKIPKTPDFIQGVINLRGLIIPTVDLRLKFGMPQKEFDINSAIVIYEVDKMYIGFIVDQVEDVLLLKQEHIVNTPNFGTNVDTSFIDKVVEVDENVIILLDLKKIFEVEELLDLESIKDEDTQ